MKLFLESLVASVMFLGYFWFPLMELCHEFGISVVVGMLGYMFFAVPILHDFCHRHPHPLRVSDYLRRVFRRRFFL